MKPEFRLVDQNHRRSELRRLQEERRKGDEPQASVGQRIGAEVSFRARVAPLQPDVVGAELEQRTCELAQLRSTMRPDVGTGFSGRDRGLAQSDVNPNPGDGPARVAEKGESFKAHESGHMNIIPGCVNNLPGRIIRGHHDVEVVLGAIAHGCDLAVQNQVAVLVDVGVQTTEFH